MDKIELKRNEGENRFEAWLNGEMAQVDYYTVNESLVAYVHTEVPLNLEGHGVGSALVKYALDYARDHGQHVMPICPFVAAYIRRHPEYQDIAVKVRTK